MELIFFGSALFLYFHESFFFLSNQGQFLTLFLFFDCQIPSLLQIQKFLLLILNFLLNFLFILPSFCLHFTLLFLLNFHPLYVTLFLGILFIALPMFFVMIFRLFLLEHFIGVASSSGIVKFIGGALHFANDLNYIKLLH